VNEVVEPIRKQLTVNAAPEKAFRVFTEGFDRWWPRAHHIGTSEMRTAVLEPRLGGRWYEVGVDGSECSWGKVLVWDPPHRLVLVWQISGQWKFDPTLSTEVEVNFIAEAPDRTRIELEHRGLDQFGAMAAAVRGQLDSGWGGLVGLFGKLAESP
jgi:uncharacterized protein YndB with AHSA1/START domain